MKTSGKHFKIIHLSDLHIGNNFSKTHDKVVARHSLKHMSEIGRLVSQEAETTDRVIISGDISDSGDTISLLLARQWIRNTLEIGDGAQISLGLSEHQYDRLRIIPGNHDAYNYKKTKKEFQILYQESLANYNKVFVEDKIENDIERYEWLEDTSKGRGVFLYYADTSYLGDPDYESINKKIKLFEKPARGKFSIEKSEKLLETFDKGMKGLLKNSEGSYIDKTMFARSLKIIVMHHYLFEPVGSKIEPLLQICDTNTVFTNIALADFDILLCGHKHIANFRDDRYIQHFDKRAKARYLINYFRRILGIYSLPLQYKDTEGKKISRFHSILLSLNLLKQVEEDHSTDKVNLDLDYLGKLNEVLLQGIEDPDKFDYYIKKLAIIDKGRTFDEKELLGLAKKIRVELDVNQKQNLKRVCKNLKKVINGLSDRHFLQVMAGSACKIRESNSNSFNIYEIESVSNGYKFHSRRYDWSHEKEMFLPPTTITYEFNDANRPLH